MLPKDDTHTVGLSPKLCAAKWKGPPLVVRKISDLLFEIKLSAKGKTKVIHHDRLKRYNGNELPGWILAQKLGEQEGTNKVTDVSDGKDKASQSVNPDNSKMQGTPVTTVNSNNVNAQDNSLRRGSRK